MARKRKRRSRKNKSKSNGSMSGMIKKVANKVASPIAFWTQLSSKDYELLNTQSNYTNLPNMEKAKVAVNILTGSLTGKVFFPQHYNPSPNGEPRINPGGVINKIVGVGVAGKAYGVIGKSLKLPEHASINKISNKVIFGGIVGGFFDPPSASSSTQAFSTSSVTPITTRNIQVRSGNAMQHYDLSTQGAFR
tara:strand:+ start:157 stop:732 length:576 start_codon:yes stop_codon:yes gene_type:complete